MSREKPRPRRGDTLCQAYAVSLPRSARTEAGEARGPARAPRVDGPHPAAVDELGPRLPVRRGGPGPRRLNGDTVCSRLPVPPGIPSRVARGAQEVVGRVLVSQTARRRAFSVLQEAWDAELGRLLDQGKVYPAVLRAREAWKARHGQDAPAAGYLLGVAEQLARDHRRCTETRWHGGTWSGPACCGQPAPRMPAGRSSSRGPRCLGSARERSGTGGAGGVEGMGRRDAGSRSVGGR